MNNLATLIQNIANALNMQLNVTYDYMNSHFNSMLTDCRAGIILIGDVLTVKNIFRF